MPPLQQPTGDLNLSLAKFLLQEKLLTEDKYQEVVAESAKRGVSVEQVIEELKLVREEDLVQAKSKLYNIPAVDLFGRMIRADVLNVIPQELAANYQIVAFLRAGDELSIAMVNPADFKALEAIEFIARKGRFRVKYFLASSSGLKYILRQYESLSAEVEEALKGAEAEAQLKVRAETATDEGLEEIDRSAPVSKMVSVILRHAVEGRASDVHIEPVGTETRVRYRIDGILHTSIVLPHHVHASVIARIKVMSNLKIDETRVPQDGRFRTTYEGRNIDYRVSTLPLINQEKVVMRILDTATGIGSLGELGFDGKGLAIMEENLSKSHGMFLITGPTGSGKSTTLYAILQVLNEEGVNIVTLEDPVEYYMDGVNQAQVNPEVGLSFAAGLRSILRQDPNIIMVGEIRDRETAELAVHASLTGHIVLSTLHTNDAFGAVPRLIDMGIEPFLIASSLNVVIAQRLVRRVCQFCGRPLALPTPLENEVVGELSSIPRDALPPDIKLVRPLTVSAGRGCPRCENSGYKGRVAISEVIGITEEARHIITSGGDVMDLLRAEFRRQGMYYMKQDGIIKALRGQTTIEEVWDATRA